MKRLVFGFFAALLLLLGAVSLNAQSYSNYMTVNVPFDFSVLNEVLPKGEYTVTETYPSGALQFCFRGRHGGAIFTSTSPTEKRGGKNAYELDFHLVNNQYFLATIWMGNDRNGRKLPASKQERELMAQFGKPEVRILTASAR